MSDWLIFGAGALAGLLAAFLLAVAVIYGPGGDDDTEALPRRSGGKAAGSGHGAGDGGEWEGDLMAAACNKALGRHLAETREVWARVVAAPAPHDSADYRGADDTMLATEATMGTGQALDDVQPYYCARCDNPKPLGMLAPGRFWSRQQGRTIIAEGGRVRVWCERCHKEHTIVLDSN